MVIRQLSITIVGFMKMILRKTNHLNEKRGCEPMTVIFLLFNSSRLPFAICH